MTAWESPGEAAVYALIEVHELDQTTAQVAVDTVFGQLSEPDRDMLEAGATELVGRQGNSRTYCRALAAAVWRAMLQRARS